MIDHFTTGDPVEGNTPSPLSFDTGAIPFTKHRHPKGKKAAKKALRKTEKERDQLLWKNGQLYSENAMLKRAIVLATAASRRKLDETMGDTSIALLPSRHR